MTTKANKTIRISEKVLQVLGSLKEHHRETYNDVLERVFKND